MYSPAHLDLTIHRRTDFGFTVRLKNEAGAAENLSGWTITSSLATEYGVQIADSFNIDTSELADGQFTLSFAASETEALAAGTYYYDVLAKDTDDQTSKVLEGCITVVDTVTDPA